MNRPRDEYLDLCAGFALGVLSDEDAARLAARLEAGDLLCEAALYEMYAGVQLLAATAPPATPRPELQARVMADVDAIDRPTGEASPATTPSKARRDPLAEARAFRAGHGPSKGAVWGMVAAAASVVAFLGWSTAQSLRNDLARAEARVVQLERELAFSEERLAEELRWARAVGAKDVRVVSIDPTTDAISQVSGRAFVDRSSGLVVVHVYDVPAMPAHSHQVWAIDGAGHTPVGFVHPDAEGHGRVRLALTDTRGVSAIAVSREPKGGSANPDGPSGPVVMLGRIDE